MSAGYQILLFFVVIGAISGMFASLGIWNNVNQVGNIGISTDTINSTYQSNQGSVGDALGTFIVLVRMIGVVFGCVMAAIFSLPTLFWAMGVPINGVTWLIVQAIQTPFQFVMFMWLYEQWTGRTVD